MRRLPPCAVHARSRNLCALCFRLSRGTRRLARRRAEAKSQRAGQVELAAEAITTKHTARDMQDYRGDNPDLPVGKQTADGEFVGYSKIRRETPESQHVSHQ